METGQPKPRMNKPKTNRSKAAPSVTSEPRSNTAKTKKPRHHTQSNTSKSNTSKSNTSKSNTSKSNTSKPNTSNPGASKYKNNRYVKNTKRPSTKTNTRRQSRPVPAQTKLVLFHKPFQVLSQFSPDGDKATLADFMHIPDIYPAGRLDFDSEGLMLLTNNGQLQHKISHPNNKMSKTYAVQVEGIPTQEQLDTLQNGVALKDGTTKPATVQLLNPETVFTEREPPIRTRDNIPDTWIELTIQEGRNRQVRRMTAAVGLPTLRLIRTSIGEYKLADLPAGEWHIMNMNPEQQMNKNCLTP